MYENLEENNKEEDKEKEENQSWVGKDWEDERCEGKIGRKRVKMTKGVEKIKRNK